MKNLFILITFLYSLFGSAQQWQWAMQTATNNSGTGKALDHDVLGNIYLAAQSSYSPCAGLSKHAFNGNLLWERSAIGANYRSLSTDKVGNIFAVGEIGGPCTFAGGNNSDIIANTGDYTWNGFIVKYNTTGDIQWLNTISDSINQNDYVFAVKTDKNGNAFLSGHSVKITNNGSLINYFIYKYDSTGNILWKKSSNWKGNVSPITLDTDENGNCYVGGSFHDSAFFNNISLSANSAGWGLIFITKYDPNGNVLWALKDGTNYNDCMALDYHQGSIFITGDYQAPSTFGSQTLGGSINGSHMFIARYDSSGSFKWARSASKAGGSGILIDNDQNSFIVGTFMKPYSVFGTGQSTLSLTSPKINNEIFVAKYDSSGIFKWAVAPGGTSGEGNWGCSITTSNNNYIVTGGFTQITTFGSFTVNSTTNSYSKDVFLAALKDSSNNIVTSVEFTNKNKLINLWPNPANDYVCLKCKSEKGFMLTIKNSFGQVISEKPIVSASTDEVFRLYLGNYPPGIYLLEVKTTESKSILKLIKN